MYLKVRAALCTTCSTAGILALGAIHISRLLFPVQWYAWRTTRFVSLSVIQYPYMSSWITSWSIFDTNRNEPNNVSVAVGLDGAHSNSLCDADRECLLERWNVSKCAKWERKWDGPRGKASRRAGRAGVFLLLALATSPRAVYNVLSNTKALVQSACNRSSRAQNRLIRSINI